MPQVTPTEKHVLESNKEERADQLEGGVISEEPEPLEQAEEKRCMCRRLTLLIALAPMLALAFGLGLGLSLKDDDSNEEPPKLDLQCIMDTKELYEKSHELDQYIENTAAETWMNCQQTGIDSMTCKFNESSDVSSEFSELCENVGGQPFIIDNAKTRCTLEIAGVDDIRVTLDIVHLVECFAKSCKTADDEAFEDAALTYLVQQLELEDEELKDCQYIPDGPDDDFQITTQPPNPSVTECIDNSFKLVRASEELQGFLLQEVIDTIDIDCQEKHDVAPGTYPTPNLLPCVTVVDFDEEDFESICTAAGGFGMMGDVSEFDLPEFFCQGESPAYELPVMGLRVNHVFMCAAMPCTEMTLDSKKEAVAQYMMRYVKEVIGLECSREFAPPNVIEQLQACRDKFQPNRVTVCEATDELCAFEIRLDDKMSCGEYCSMHGGTCLYTGGYDSCAVREDNRQSCDVFFGDDFCACTM